jgi:hypothetical protein
MSSTVDRYAHLAARYVLFTIRTIDHPIYSQLYHQERAEILHHSTNLKNMEHISLIPTDQSEHTFWIQSPLHSILHASICYINPIFRNDLDFPIIRFLCYASLTYHDCFIPLREITPLIAILEFLVKAVVMNSIILEQDIGQHQGTIDEVVIKYHPFVRDGLQTPFNQLRENQHLASSHVLSQGSVPRILWLDDKGESLMIDGMKFELGDIRMIAKNGLQAARAHLDSVLLLNSGLASTDLLERFHIIDHPRTEAVGHHFLLDPNNRELKKLQFSLLNFINSSTTARHDFVITETDTSINFDDRAIRKWMRDCNIFLSILFTLIHITSGQPSRDSELGGLRFANGNGLLRNLFVQGNRVMTLIPNSKAKSVILREKGIPRVLPHPVSRLLVEYLVFVRPIQQIFAKQLQISSPSLSIFLFTDMEKGGYWNGDRICLEFKRCASSWFPSGRIFGIRQYRHVAIALFMRWHLREELFTLHEKDNILDLQAGHSTSIANKIYAIDSLSHPHIPPNLLHLFTEASHEWAKLLDLITDPNHIELQQMESASQSLPLPQTNSVPQNEVLPLMLTSTTAARALVHRIDHGLAQLHGDQAKFLSVEQQQALYLVLARDRDLLVVLPTGGGKSLLFQLPPLIEKGLTTIVVVPFVALKQQFGHSQNGVGDVRVWNKLQPLPPQVGQLVVVSAEDAIENAFLNYLHGLHTNQLLARIVFDECHIPGEQGNFRNVMRPLLELRSSKLSVPVVLLSASVGPSMVPGIKKDYCCDILHIVRATTNRPNLLYRVIEVSKVEDIMPTIISFLLDRPKPFQTERGIIYCPTRDLVKSTHLEITKQFGPIVTLYHGNLNPEERSKADREWRSGHSPWIVATSAFGVGVDEGRVRWIVQYGQPFSLTEFFQQSGRAGRDRLPALSLTITSTKFLKQLPPTADVTKCAPGKPVPLVDVKS